MLERGLAADPAQRFPTMRALLGALRAARSRGHLVAGGVAIGLLAIAVPVAIAWPGGEAAPPVDCAAAGLSSTTLGLDVPARIAAAGQPTNATRAAAQLAYYRGRHAAMATEVCRNGLVTHAWSPELYRRGTACLALREGIVRWQLALTPAADLAELTASLIIDTACTDASILASRPPLPEDPAQLAEVVRVRARLDVAVGREDVQLAPREVERIIAEAEASPMRSEPTVAVRIDGVRGILKIQQGAPIGEVEPILAKTYYATRAIDDVDFSLNTLGLLITTTSRAEPDGKLARSWIQIGLADAARARRRAPRVAAALYTAIATRGDEVGDTRSAHAHLADALALIGDTPSRQLADVLMVRASVYITEGNAAAALADYQRALALFEQLLGADSMALANARLNASAGMLALGREDEAVELAEQAERVVASYHGLPTRDTARMELNIGVSYISRRDFAAARAHLTRARELTIQRLGAQHADVALIDANLGHVALQEHDFDAAERLARQALALQETAVPDPHEDRGMALLLLADAARGKHDSGTAITAAVRSASQYAATDERRRLSLVVAAMVANDSAQFARAKAIVDQLRALPDPSDPILAGRTMYEAGRVVAGIGGDPAKARRILEAARAAFVAGEATAWAAEVDAALAKLR